MIDHAATIAVAALGLVLLAVALPMAIVYRRACRTPPERIRPPQSSRDPGPVRPEVEGAMSEEKWPGEPWYAVDSGNAAELWEVCCGPRGEDGELIASMCSEGEARRIVAAVNAVAGIPTEALESGALAKALDAVVARGERLPLDGTAAEKSNAWLRRVRAAEAELESALRSLGRLP